MGKFWRFCGRIWKRAMPMNWAEKICKCIFSKHSGLNRTILFYLPFPPESVYQNRKYEGRSKSNSQYFLEWQHWNVVGWHLEGIQYLGVGTHCWCLLVARCKGHSISKVPYFKNFLFWTKCDKIYTKCLATLSLIFNIINLPINTFLPPWQ